MSAPPLTPARIPPRWLRVVLAVLLSALLGAVAWLIVVQEAFKKELTDHSANRAMGYLVGAENEGVPRWGLVATLAVGVVLATLYGIARHRIPGDWLARGAATGAVMWLGWALVFGPLTAGHPDAPSGWFGLEADPMAPVVALVGSLTGGIALTRVYDLVASAAWWQPRREDLESAVAALVDADPAARRPDEP